MGSEDLAANHDVMQIVEVYFLNFLFGKDSEGMVNMNQWENSMN